VPVNDADVRRLMSTTGLPADKIVRLYSSADLEVDASHAWIRFPNGRRVLGLKHRGAACRFLSPHGLCTVYESRPTTCRTYPYMVYFAEDGRLEAITFNKGVDCCARLGRHWRRQTLLADARQEDADDQRYHGKVRAWEKAGRKGGKRGLLRFLGLA
jgi:Fe-S-cluster containining protein